jgi:hypothetical protein
MYSNEREGLLIENEVIVKAIVTIATNETGVVGFKDIKSH